MIYGKNKKEADALREFEGGRLLSSTVDGIEFLQTDEDMRSCAIPKNRHPDKSCFTAGDKRVNVHAGLVTLHALFHRYHNMLAFEYQEMNPHLSDQIVYQEVRRIVIAQLQHVTYNELLPLILGQQAMLNFGLTLKEESYSNNYDPSVNPQILASFASAAFRLHTLIPKTLEFSADDKKSLGSLDLSENFNNPSTNQKHSKA